MDHLHQEEWAVTQDAAVNLVVSTGRCGTQWLADNLASSYSQVQVTHEPVGPAYAPRRFLRSAGRPEAVLSVPEVAKHVDRLRLRIPVGGYIETGWPLFAAVPLFVTSFPGRVRLIHLTRHPVPTSLSHMVHKLYAGSPRDDAYTRLAALDPWCPGVLGTEYRDRWARLTPFEKCLFWWAEVHAYALELRSLYPEVPFLHVKSEDMLSGDERTLKGLTRFLGLPWKKGLAEAAGERVDRWHHRTDEPFDATLVHEHPRLLELTEELGYDLVGLDPRALEARYRGVPTPYEEN